MAISPKSNVRFRERAELLDFLLEVSTVTSETLDLDRLLSNVAEIVKDVIPYELFAILLYNERTRTLRMRYSIGHRDEVAKSLAIRLGEGIVGNAGALRQPIVVRDVRQDPRYLNALDPVRAELAAPMLVRGKLVGVIDLQATRVDAFSEQDRALLALIASRVGVAIDNAWLYRRVERQNKTLRLLAHLSHEFSSILDIDELLTKIALTVRALINFDSFSIFLVAEDRKMLTCRFTQRYDKTPTVENIEWGKGVTGAAADSRQIIRVPNVKDDVRYIATQSDILSEIAVPLIVRDRVIGVMDLESVRLGFFTEDHARTLSLLAPQIATSVENARLYAELAQREQRMEEDLGAARKLQSVLLPRTFSDVTGLDAAIQSRPAREITGDVYDLFEQNENYSIIAFGDVSGKGAAAALYGALISGLLRILAPRQRAPAALMKVLNDALLERRVDAQYATLCLALWDAPKRTFTICNAGALPPMILRKGEIIDVRAEGVPIGLLDERDYEQVPLPVERGDLVLFYSDGVEDQLSDHDEYGRARLQKLISYNGEKTPGEIARAVLLDIDDFRGATPITDDQTVIALRVL